MRQIVAIKDTITCNTVDCVWLKNALFAKHPFEGEVDAPRPRHFVVRLAFG